MKLNYDTLGKYIKLIDVRNQDLTVEKLLGVSITKQFIPSIANTVGTDFSSYKVVKHDQFAYGPVTSRNGDKMSIALLDDEECIVSSSYLVFKVIDTKRLLPEYLMLWFKRPEFDRYARFKSHGSVREIFDWDEMCKVKLPVPDISVQRSIIQAYNTLERRIHVKQQINDNLLATGICILDNLLGSVNLVNSTSADIDSLKLPEGWTIQMVSEYAQSVKSGSTPSRTDYSFWENGTIPWLKSGEVHNNVTISTEEFITELGLRGSSTHLLPPDTVLMAMYGVTAGEVGYLAIPSTTNQAICGMVCKTKAQSAFLYFTLLFSQQSISRLSNGGAQDNLSKAFIESIKLVVPSAEHIETLGLSTIVEQITVNTREISTLEQTQDTLLSRLSSRQ
ncbi:MAG: restriction endonuclease subunit S [Bacillota bacterium]